VRGLNPPSDPGQRYATAATAIDAANADDPTMVSVRGATGPLAQVHGQLADEWVTRLSEGPGDGDELVRLAARAHHLRRWEMPRTEYLAGRAGYLRWRRDQKKRHATDVADILGEIGFEQSAIERVGALIRREGLGTDPETQLVEDAACLVFIETQLSSVAQRFDREHLLEVIRKTARKMSPAALAAVSEIQLGEIENQLLSDALS
jgi:hypothetical protein